MAYMVLIACFLGASPRLWQCMLRALLRSYAIARVNTSNCLNGLAEERV